MRVTSIEDGFVSLLLTCTESRLVGCISTVIIVITKLCGRDTIIICTRIFTNRTLLVDTGVGRVLWLHRLLNTVYCCDGVAQVYNYYIDFPRNHFSCIWFHSNFLFPALPPHVAVFSVLIIILLWTWCHNWTLFTSHTFLQ